jgi:hypothetical protein
MQMLVGGVRYTNDNNFKMYTANAKMTKVDLSKIVYHKKN